jgi:signal transduction histidine kinase
MTSPTVANSPTLPDCEPRQLVSDLFHALSQPLTTLCCSLELTLQQTPTAEQYRESTTRALAQAERVSWLVTGIRELFDASEASSGEVLELQAAVQGVVSDLLPVAESAGVRICYLPRSACPVRFDAQRLRQGLFHLLEFAVGSCERGAVVKIELAEAGEEVVLGIVVCGDRVSCDQEPGELARRLGLGIARAIFEAAGGSFLGERSVGYLGVEVRMPRCAVAAS